MPLMYELLDANSSDQGRAGWVALSRYRGGVGALGKAYYKGGFEPKMNRREAALILSLRYCQPTGRICVVCVYVDAEFIGLLSPFSLPSMPCKDVLLTPSEQ